MRGEYLYLPFTSGDNFAATDAASKHAEKCKIEGSGVSREQIEIIGYVQPNYATTEWQCGVVFRISPGYVIDADSEPIVFDMTDGISTSEVTITVTAVSNNGN